MQLDNEHYLQDSPQCSINSWWQDLCEPLYNKTVSQAIPQMEQVEANVIAQVRSFALALSIYWKILGTRALHKGTVCHFKSSNYCDY